MSEASERVLVQTSPGQPARPTRAALASITILAVLASLLMCAVWLAWVITQLQECNGIVPGLWLLWFLLPGLALLPNFAILWLLRKQRINAGLILAGVWGAILLPCLALSFPDVTWEAMTAVPSYYAPLVLWAVSAPQMVLALIAVRAYARMRATRFQLMQVVGIIMALEWAVVTLVAGAPLLFPPRIEYSNAPVVAILRTINTSEAFYRDTYGRSFSPSLAALGPPACGAPPSASGAGLIRARDARGRLLLAEYNITYTLTYTPGPKDASGRIKSYTLSARPDVYMGDRTYSYFTDESGVIRYTSENRRATAQDPPVGG